MLAEESNPLSLDFEVKGQCWACWETEETVGNPLIRTCRGCKDVDLKWIHQECMNNYISLLPQDVENEMTSLHCTRCRDPYQFESIRINPFKLLLKDKLVLVPMIFMTLCIIMITVQCIQNLAVLSDRGFSESSTLTMAFHISMIATSYICYIIAWVLVDKCCLRKYKRSIKPLNFRETQDA
jgi:hypothetical protein